MSSPSSTRTAGWPRTIGARLTLAFAALLGLFVTALAMCALAFADVERAEREVEGIEGTRRAADRAAILMREQYIHQAHTLIVFDDTHLDHYRDVAVAAAASVAALAASPGLKDEPGTVEQLSVLQHQSDEIFRSETVPAVLAGDHPRAIRLHEDMERSVVEFSRAVRALHERNDARAANARRTMDAAWTRARAVSLSCLVAAVVVGLAVAVFLRRSVVRRLTLLRAGASQVGSGDLEHRLDLDGEDELADLGRAFDAMTRRLAAYQAEQVRTQRLASIGQVAAGVAHELNNPLGVILGYAKLLRKRGGHDSESLAVIEQEARLASEIVESMLDLARPMSLKLGAVRLGILVGESVERLAQRDRFSEVHFSAPPAAGSDTVQADEARLRQVLVNVLTNAGEAVRAGGRVVATIAQEPGTLAVVVEDDGPGLPPGRSLPEPFLTTKPQGVGLGLSIARAIVEAHHGTLELGASALGGARVTIRLPDAPPDGAR